MPVGAEYPQNIPKLQDLAADTTFQRSDRTRLAPVDVICCGQTTERGRAFEDWCTSMGNKRASTQYDH